MIYALQPADETYLEENFKYHPPAPSQKGRYGELRRASKSVAERILQSCPPSRERSLALTNLEQAMFWANAAIARNEKWEAECSS